MFLFSTGARAESASRGRGNETEGVQGLKSLGVRDLHHKTAFLACNVLCGTMRIGDDAADNNEEASPATIKVIIFFSKNIYSSAQRKFRQKNS